MGSGGQQTDGRPCLAHLAAGLFAGSFGSRPKDAPDVVGLRGELEVAFPDRPQGVHHGVGDRPFELAVAVELGGQVARSGVWP